MDVINVNQEFFLYYREQRIIYTGKTLLALKVITKFPPIALLFIHYTFLIQYSLSNELIHHIL